MRSIRKFLRLPITDQCLLIESAFLLGAVRVALWLLPFQVLRRLLARITRMSSQQRTSNDRSLEQVVWAVGTASHYIPQASTCLTQALVAQVLLGRRGHPAHLRIGIARDAAGQLQAHAWVESGGKIVLGDLQDLWRYNPLPPLEDIVP